MTNLNVHVLLASSNLAVSEVVSSPYSPPIDSILRSMTWG